MLDAALAASALLMGLAGTPHCLAMCGAACTGLTGLSRPALLAFMVGRLFSYSLAGAAASASVGLLAQLGQASPLLRPVWVLLHVAALLLGLGLLIGPTLLTYRQRLGPSAAAAGMQLSVRLSGLGLGLGLGLALASSWALGHGVWQQVLAFCS